MLTSLSRQRREAHYLAAAKAWIDTAASLDQVLSWARTDAQKNPGTIVVISANIGLVDIYRQFSRATGHLPVAVGPDPFRLMVSNYVAPIATALDVAGLSTHVVVRRGDGIQPLSFPALIKARLIAQPGVGILVPTQWSRHFGPMREVQQADMSWETKKPRLVWRGTTTGPGPGENPHRPSSRSWIADVAMRTRNSTTVDVGYSKTLNTRKFPENPRRHKEIRGWPQGDQVADYVKPRLSMAECLENKYLLSLEGNDVASGLKWMMASRSCVLMPPPSVESWFCESLLEPWRHYVPVKPDLSDLEEKVQWCQDHDAQAEEIARAGQDFSQAFVDSVTENALLTEILRWWDAQPLLDDATRISYDEAFLTQ